MIYIISIAPVLDFWLIVYMTTLLERIRTLENQTRTSILGGVKFLGWIQPKIFGLDPAQKCNPQNCHFPPVLSRALPKR